MTASDVFLDSTGWWEIIAASPKGAALRKRYLLNDNVRVHTSALTVGELVAKATTLAPSSEADHIPSAIRAASRLHDVTPELAASGGRLRGALRKRHPDASLADAIILATARSVGAKLVTNDRALVGESDVVEF